MRRFIGLVVFVAWTLAARHACADLEVTVATPTTITAGGTADIDIYVQSNNGTTGDLLNFFTLGLQIDPVGSVNSQLVFDPNYQPSVDTYGSNYVFASGSGDASATAPLGGPLQFDPTTSNYAGDQYFGADYSTSGDQFDNITVGSSPMLLAVVQVTTNFATAGDSFTISLVPTGDDNPPGTDVTSFSYGDPVLGIGYDSFSSTPGTITILGNQQPQPPGGGGIVPEPATWQLALTGMALAGLFAWRRPRLRPVACD